MNILIFENNDDDFNHLASCIKTILQKRILIIIFIDVKTKKSY